ncbi:uncharacterized protein LOC122081126 [Macadamia integrifolia]|uniref:uncharacterized protein LOC122081126 n=1 Tax=Macadamia integrifolia TaxID=60698 RepID=UPI001C4FC2B8|nr:uncharacterized protein LOC122081126 [Macadamia integrifolia]
MVGVFSRFSGRTGHRRAQSALDERQVLPPNSEGNRPSTTAAAAAASHGIEVAVQFKPVEHPIEPLDNDRPVKCPLPEPSILNDARIWKERMSANARRRADLPVMKEGANLESESEAGGTKQCPAPSNRMMLPSLSAPEHNIINLLEEYNASSI